MEDSGSWTINCNKKADFIKKKLLEHKKTVVWLDADAVVKEYPKYFDIINEDIGVFYRNREELISATLFFKYNGRVIQVLDRWIKQSNLGPFIFDQGHLKNVLNGFMKDKVSIFYLPNSYNKFFDMDIVDKPIIEQFQASRKLRR